MSFSKSSMFSYWPVYKWINQKQFIYNGKTYTFRKITNIVIHYFLLEKKIKTKLFPKYLTFIWDLIFDKAIGCVITS